MTRGSPYEREQVSMRCFATGRSLLAGLDRGHAIDTRIAHPKIGTVPDVAKNRGTGIFIMMYGNVGMYYGDPEGL